MSWEGGSRLLLLFVARLALGEFRGLIARASGEALAIQGAEIGFDILRIATGPSSLRPFGALSALEAERRFHILGHR